MARRFLIFGGGAAASAAAAAAAAAADGDDDDDDDDDGVVVILWRVVCRIRSESVQCRAVPPLRLGDSARLLGVPPLPSRACVRRSAKAETQRSGGDAAAAAAAADALAHVWQSRGFNANPATLLALSLSLFLSSAPSDNAPLHPSLPSFPPSSHA